MIPHRSESKSASSTVASANSDTPTDTQEKDLWHFADPTSGGFSVISGNGHLLSCAVYHRFLQAAPSGNVALLCHGIFTSKANKLIQYLATELHITTVAFDFHGNGESEGDETWSFGGYQGECDADLRQVVLFLRNHDIAPVLLVGHSRGANVVMQYAMTYDDVPLVVSIAARFRMDRGINQRFGEHNMKLLEDTGRFEMKSSDGRRRIITQEAVQDRKSFSFTGLSKIRNTKLLIVHGSNDQVVPYEDGVSLHQTAATATEAHLLTLEGGSHSIADSDKCVDDVTNSINDFLRLQFNVFH